MSAKPFSAILRRLQQMAGEGRAEQQSDRQLLECFLTRRDEAAFATLVERHGRLVFRVCRSILRQEQDAEDAFQATFLVLARMGPSIRKRDSLASWLYGVALRTARKARQAGERRRSREEQAGERTPADPVSEAALREVQAILHEEVGRLPAKYRVPFLLCCLQGKGRSEAAEELGWNEGTLSGRIAQARALLESRLSRRGIALTAALTAAVLAASEAPAAVPLPLVQNTLALASGGGAAIISSRAAILAEGVMRAMWITKAKIVAGIALMMLVLGGAGLLAYPVLKPAKPVPEADEVPQARQQPEKPRPPEQPPAAEPDVKPENPQDNLPPHALIRLGSLRWRFSGPIMDLTYSADGKWVVVAENKNIHVLEAATGAEIRGFQAQDSLIRSLVLSRDNKVAVTGGSRTIQLWDAATGKRIREFTGHANGSWGLCGSADGKILAALGEDTADDRKGLLINNTVDYSVRVWDATTGQPLKPFANGLKGAVNMALSPNGDALAWTAHDGTVRVVTVDDGKERFRFQLRKQPKLRPPWIWLTFSPDSATLAYGDEDSKIILRDARTGKELQRCERKDPGKHDPATGLKPTTTDVHFSADGKQVAAVWEDTAFEMWDTRTGREIRRFNIGSYRFALSPDGKTLAQVPLENTIGLVDLATGKKKTAPGQYPPLALLGLSPDGKTVATAENLHDVKLWDRKRGTVLHTLHLEDIPHGGALLPDGQTLLLVGGKPSLWDVRTGKKKRDLLPLSELSCMAVSPDGRLLAIGGGHGDILLCDLVENKQSRLVGNRKAWVFSLAFSGDGKKLVAGTDSILQPDNKPPLPDNAIYVWDMTTRNELRRIQAPPQTVNKLAVSPDGKFILASPTTQDVGNIPVWDLDSGKEVKRLPSLGGPPLSALAFSPDGKTLALACNLPSYAEGQGTIYLLDGKTLKMFGVLKGHQRAVSSLAFSADGSLLASSGDGTVLVWDMAKVKR